MRKMIKSVLVLILLCPFLSFASQKLIFATEATYPPYVYMTSVGKIDGFGAAIVRSVCRTMKASCVIVNRPFESLIPGLQLGKFSGIFGGLSITKAREQQVSFTQPYYVNAAAMVAAKSSHLGLSPQLLAGKTIGVQSGNTFAAYIKSKYGSKVTISYYPSIQDALLDLQSGRINAVMGDQPTLQAWLNKATNQDFAIIGKPIVNSNYFGIGNGIAVKKGNAALLKRLNRAITKLKSSGEYQKILRTYFGS